MKTLSCLLILLSAPLLYGQASPEPARVLVTPSTGITTKVITLKYPNRVSMNLLDGIGLSAYRNSGEIVVVTGLPDKVAVAEAILKAMDVPPPPAVPKKNIQLTAYLIVAASTGAQGTPIPKDLESPVAQVASMFSYKSFILLDSIVMRATENSSAKVSGLLPNGAMPVDSFFPRGSIYNLDVRGIALPAQPENTMQISGFHLDLQRNTGIDKEGRDKFQSVTLQTNVDMKEGQKVVVGKANIDGSSNAVIVILTAKVVD